MHTSCAHVVQEANLHMLRSGSPLLVCSCRTLARQDSTLHMEISVEWSYSTPNDVRAMLGTRDIGKWRGHLRPRNINRHQPVDMAAGNPVTHSERQGAEREFGLPQLQIKLGAR